MEMPNSLDNLRHRYLALDGLRGVAAVAVVIHHIFWTFGGQPMFSHGPLAVDFFFILSGFVVSYAYERRLASGEMSFWTFVVRRCVRLYPMIFLGALLGLALMLIIGENPESSSPFHYAIPSFLCLPLYFIESGSRDFLNPPGWSLFFEIVASFAYAAFAPRMPTRFLIYAMGVAGLGLAFGDIRFHTNQLGNVDFLFGFARVAFSFTAGAVLQRSIAVLPAAPKVPAWLVAAFIIAPMALPNLNRASPFVDIGSVFLIFPIGVWLGAQSPAGTGLYRQAIIFLGEISFPLYIMHWPLFRWIKTLLVPYLPAIDARIYGAFATIVAIIVSFIVLKVYDEPVRNWLSRLAASRAARRSRGADRMRPKPLARR